MNCLSDSQCKQLLRCLDGYFEEELLRHDNTCTATNDHGTISPHQAANYQLHLVLHILLSTSEIPLHELWTLQLEASFTWKQSTKQYYAKVLPFICLSLSNYVQCLSVYA